MKNKQAVDNYLEINRKSWNTRTDVHVQSAFYNMESFLNGNTSLKSIELELLGDIQGKRILHLQCHFGQDTISLARMGATVTGVDFSDRAIHIAQELAKNENIEASFICQDIYNLPTVLEEKFDIVFTSYGTIGWLPDLDKWAQIIAGYLKPGGRFIFAEFHPVIWMFDAGFDKIEYPYFNAGAIVESESGTYADTSATIHEQYISWNHGIGEVMSSLLKNGLTIQSFSEFDYSPYDCFKHTEEYEPEKYRIKHLGNKIPMVYALEAKKMDL